MDLVEWLRVQLDEDERSGSVAHCADCTRGSEYAGTMYECDVDAARTRALREVEAKRQIIDIHGSRSDPCDAHGPDLRSIPCDTLLLLALPFDARPGYREEW